MGEKWTEFCFGAWGKSMKSENWGLELIRHSGFLSITAEKSTWIFMYWFIYYNAHNKWYGSSPKINKFIKKYGKNWLSFVGWLNLALRMRGGALLKL